MLESISLEQMKKKCKELTPEIYTDPGLSLLEHRVLCLPASAPAYV